MVRMNPDWARPFGNGWAVQLVVIVEGDSVGIAAESSVPEGTVREIETEILLQRLVDCFCPVAFEGIQVKLWEAFAKQLLQRKMPGIKPESTDGKALIARMRDSHLIYRQFELEATKAIAEALTHHLTEWWEVELEALVLEQLRKPEANQNHYVFHFPPDELGIIVVFASPARLHSEGEQSIAIEEGERFSLPHKIEMSTPARLVLRLGDSALK